MGGAVSVGCRDADAAVDTAVETMEGIQARPSNVSS
jgi:hypothetical protein